MTATTDAAQARPNAAWTPKIWLTAPAPQLPTATSNANAELVQVKASVIVPPAADRPVNTYEPA